MSDELDDFTAQLNSAETAGAASGSGVPTGPSAASGKQPSPE